MEKLIDCIRRPILVHSGATELLLTVVGKLANCTVSLETLLILCGWIAWKVDRYTGGGFFKSEVNA